MILSAMTLLLFAGNTAMAFDPFATPPKNMQAAGTVEAQSYTGGIAIPPPPPPPLGSAHESAQEESPLEDFPQVDFKNTQAEESYIGTLLHAQSDTDDNLNHYLLDTGATQIPMNTKKNLDDLINQEVTVYIHRNGDTLSIKSITLSSEAAEKSAEKTTLEEKINKDKSLKNIATGPAIWGLLALFFVLVTSGAYFLSRKRKKIPVAKDDSNPFKGL